MVSPNAIVTCGPARPQVAYGDKTSKNVIF